MTQKSWKVNILPVCQQTISMTAMVINQFYKQIHNIQSVLGTKCSQYNTQNQ